MKHSLLSFTILLVLVNISSIVYSQRSPEKFGQIKKSNFIMTVCPIDSNAHAYYIFDYGNSYFQYADKTIRSNEAESSRKGFQLFFKRHFRIKIADKQGLSWANIEIPLYHAKDKEIVTSIKARTYNLENGKVVKHKLSKKDIFTEETSKHWNTKKFAMPGVREGSIIEIEYTIKSDYYFNLRSWYFQSSIPALQSEYHVKVPEYFTYNQTQKGYLPIQHDTDETQNAITITYYQSASGVKVNEQKSTNTIEFKENIFNYYAKNIPAFPLEEYLKTADNYLAKIEFELNYTKFPNSKINSYTTNWDKINRNLLKNEQFGKQLSRSVYSDKEIDALKQANKDEYALLNAALNYAQKHFTWNKQNSIYVTNSLHKAYKQGNGNCADINLNLVVLLRELGFKADPIVLSTQQHGFIHPAHPSISSFNYVIASVQLDQKNYLLDATDPNANINLLPIRCLNDKGRTVNETGGDWVNLMDYKPYSRIDIISINLDDSLKLKGTKRIRLKDYALYQHNSKLQKFNSFDQYKKAFKKDHKNFKIEDMKISTKNTLKNTLDISYKFKQTKEITQSSDLIYFSPVLMPFISKNPFKLEERKYPIEYNYPLSSKQIYSLTIPEGY